MQYTDYAGQAFNNYFDNRNKMRENAANRQLQYDKLNARYGNNGSGSQRDTLDMMAKLNEISVQAQQAHKFAEQNKRQMQQQFLKDAGTAMAIMRDKTATPDQKAQATASYRSLCKQFGGFFDEEIAEMGPNVAELLENAKPSNLNELTGDKVRSLAMQLNSNLNAKGIGFNVHGQIKDEDVYNARNDLTTMADPRNRLAMQQKRSAENMERGKQRMQDLQGLTPEQGTPGEPDYIPAGQGAPLRSDRQKGIPPGDYQPDLSNEGQLALERKDQLTDPNYAASEKGFRDFNTYEFMQIIRDGRDAECLAGLNEDQMQAIEDAINTINGGAFHNDKFVDMNKMYELLASEQIESYSNMLRAAQAQYGLDSLRHLEQENTMEHNAKDNTILAQENTNKVLGLQRNYLDNNPNLSSLQTYNTLNTTKFDPNTGTMGLGQHQQPQVLGGGSGSNSDKNAQNLHSISTTMIQSLATRNGGKIGNTEIKPEMTFDQGLQTLIANRDYTGIKELFSETGNTLVYNPKTGKQERLADMIAEYSQSTSSKYSGLVSSAVTATQQQLGNNADRNDVLVATFNNLISYMPGDWFGGATNSAKINAMTQAINNNSKMIMRSNGAIYTGTKNDLKNINYKTLAYSFEINSANIQATLNSLESAIANSTNLAEKIALGNQVANLTQMQNYNGAISEIMKATDKTFIDKLPKNLQVNTDSDNNLVIPLETNKYASIIKASDGEYFLMDKNGVSTRVPLDKLNDMLK